MLQNAYFLAKFGADTSENEQHFAEVLPTDGPPASPSWLPLTGNFKPPLLVPERQGQFWRESMDRPQARMQVLKRSSNESLTRPCSKTVLTNADTRQLRHDYIEERKLSYGPFKSTLQWIKSITCVVFHGF